MAPKSKSKSKAKAKSKGKSKLSTEEIEARNRILEDFRGFDLNGDGLLQRGELKVLLKVLDPDAWNDDSIDRLISAFDKDGDGDISLEEFVDWVTGVTDDTDHDVFTETLNKSKGDIATKNRKHAQSELEHLKGVKIAAEVQAISDSDLEPVTLIEAPLEALKRLFALIWLLLQPSTTKASGKPVCFNPPSWSAVQKLLQDSSFLQRVCLIDKRRNEMRVTHGAVAIFAVEQYFSLPESGEERPAPLSYENILEACQSHKIRNKGAPVMALYKWCLAMLEVNLKEQARDKLREQATIELEEETQRERLAKEHEQELAMEMVKGEAAGVLGEVDGFLAEVS